MRNILVPERRVVLPKPPSYVLADWAFAVGAGSQLGDKSRYRAHGTISGAQWATGLHGAALDFLRATPSYVEVTPLPDHLAFSAEPWSLVMRVNFDSLLYSTMLICHGAYGEDGWYCNVLNDGTINVYTSQSGTAQVSSSAIGAVSAGSWYTLGLSRAGAAVRIYQNGVDITSVADTHLDPVATARTLKIGVYDSKAYMMMEGLIEFCRLFGVALTASEHLAYHNALA